MQPKQRGWRSLLILLGVLLMLGSIAPSISQAQDSKYYFPETGHYLGGSFKSYWDSRGGLAIFGYPITEEFIQESDGRIVQYFERARFEVITSGTSSFVGLGLIGADYMNMRGLGFPRVAAPRNEPNVRYFPETGHTLRGAFKSFWESRGSLDIFGFPLSEEITEQLEDGNNYTVQYFERARFQMVGNSVHLGLLGTALAPCQLRPGLPPNSPPPGPVPQGDPNDCKKLPNVNASGRVYPNVSVPGTILGFEAQGYEPNEPVSMWFNLPNGTTRALPYQAIADGTGYVLIGLRTEQNDPLGQWALVGQGTRSGRVVVAPFVLQR